MHLALALFAVVTAACVDAASAGGTWRQGGTRRTLAGTPPTGTPRGTPEGTPVPGMPDWVQPGALNANMTASIEENRKIMADINASGRRLDFVLYGDSITAFHQRAPATWEDQFAGWDAVPLGVGGSTVELAAWRIMSGNELPAKAPLAIALMLSVNNLNLGIFGPDTVEHYEALVTFLQHTFPDTPVVMMALLPVKGRTDVDDVNARLEGIAERRNATWAACGQDMDPDDRRLYQAGGLHLEAPAYDEIILPCLKAAVHEAQPVLFGSPAAVPAASPAPVGAGPAPPPSASTRLGGTVLALVAATLGGALLLA